jgi:hypothetical protein
MFLLSYTFHPAVSQERKKTFPFCIQGKFLLNCVYEELVRDPG